MLAWGLTIHYLHVLYKVNIVWMKKKEVSHQPQLQIVRCRFLSAISNVARNIRSTSKHCPLWEWGAGGGGVSVNPACTSWPEHVGRQGIKLVRRVYNADSCVGFDLCLCINSHHVGNTVTLWSADTALIMSIT